MDSAALFAMIFGSEKFESYLGELQLATQMQEMTNAADQTNTNTHENHPKIKKFKQRKREVKCASQLVDKLQCYIDAKGTNEAEFKEMIKKEAIELAETVCVLIYVHMY